MAIATANRTTAKHALITDALIDEIERGRYKIGGLLPSEPELAKLFGVSRQTVRVALRNLRGQLPEADLCARLHCTVENLKRWEYIGVPGKRSAEVIGLWHGVRRGLVA